VLNDAKSKYELSPVSRPYRSNTPSPTRSTPLPTSM